MRKRQLRHLIYGLNPIAAATEINAAGYTGTEAAELLTPNVIADFAARLPSEPCARACKEWETALRTGAWTWDNVPRLAGYLAVIRRTATISEHKHRSIHITRHTTYQEPVTIVDYTDDLKRRDCAEYWESELTRRSTGDDPVQPSLIKRAALIDMYFPPEAELTPISQTQARRAISLAGDLGAATTAASIVNNTTGAETAAIGATMFPFLSGIPAGYQLEILSTIASWGDDLAYIAMRFLCYHDSVRRGPRRGQYPAHICPADEAPQIATLTVC